MGRNSAPGGRKSDKRGAVLAHNFVEVVRSEHRDRGGPSLILRTSPGGESEGGEGKDEDGPRPRRRAGHREEKLKPEGGHLLDASYLSLKLRSQFLNNTVRMPGCSRLER